MHVRVLRRLLLDSAEYAGEVDGYFSKAMALLAGIVGDGQEVGEIRDGGAYAIAHLYSVLVNEHVLLTNGDESKLTPEQFHGLIDGALRNPSKSPSSTRHSSETADSS